MGVPPLLAMGRGHRLESFRDDLSHATVNRERDVLHQSSNRERRLPPDRATVGQRFTAHDLQKRRLTRAVPADDGDPFASVDLHRRPIEQRQVAVGKRDAVERDKGHLANVPRNPNRCGDRPNGTYTFHRGRAGDRRPAAAFPADSPGPFTSWLTSRTISRRSGSIGNWTHPRGAAGYG